MTNIDLQILAFVDRNMDIKFKNVDLNKDEKWKKFCFCKQKSLERDLQILGFVDRNIYVNLRKYYKVWIQIKMKSGRSFVFARRNP